MGNVSKVVGCILFAVPAAGCFVISVLQFCEKGYLFNNAYLYASRKERETMDKTPYYRQSGVAFLLVGLLFAVNAAELLLHTGWLYYTIPVIAAAATLYAVISEIVIERNQEKRYPR